MNAPPLIWLLPNALLAPARRAAARSAPAPRVWHRVAAALATTVAAAAAGVSYAAPGGFGADNLAASSAHRFTPAGYRRGAAMLTPGAPSGPSASFAPGFGNDDSRPALRLGLSQRTALVYEPEPERPWADKTVAGNAPGEHRIGLEFRNPAGGVGVPKNLLRVQLSGRSTLHFRPRGGGLTVTWRSQF